MAARTDEITCIESNGNVFADPGLPNPEEALAKAELARQIGSIIVERGLTQTAAAWLLGTDRSRVSLLVRGRLDGFSLDLLLRFLLALDRGVQIVVQPRSRSAGRVRVVAE